MMIHSAIWSEQGVTFFNKNPGKKGRLIHRSFSAPFLPNLFLFVLKENRTNFLFLQANCSFDFGIEPLYQYTVSFTHSIHNIPYSIHNQE
jgi:hypothetical protein